MASESIQAIVLAVARKQLPAAQQAALDNPQTSLRDAGITSLALVSVICDLEARFDVSFPADSLHESTFRNADTVAAALVRLGAAPPA
jgi:acyl carrier protein